MADFCSRLWVLQLNLWAMALVTGGISADNSTWNSTADSGCITVRQYPRFVGAKRNTPIQFICYFEDPHSIQWYKLAEGSDDFHELSTSTPRYSIQTTENFTSFTISSITYEDNGIYVCDRKNLTAQQRPHDCGTQLKVLSHSNIRQVQSRNTLKDAIIIIQSILLVVFISVPILLFLNKGEGKESLEEDHTYEGLEVEQMATYEDITPFRDVKAKWTVGEHPGEE
ncbi:B-cell antigen receptor complex-associated protein beta chain isoform X1 [Pezoporus occidentalis]|uniref:B-cell antigen receptor complex-associated protein beta chain isoform X1 n=1 Tax=Pezoporus occidentalis TaxID=407982 RepID=UPI002F910F6D